MIHKHLLQLALLFAIGGGVFSLFIPVQSHADTVADLQAKIAEKNSTIESLDREIAEYQKQLTATGKEKQTLQRAIATLQNTRKKLLTEISKTIAQIDAASLSIESLGIKINEEQNAIDRNYTALSEMIRETNQAESTNLLVTILTYEQISNAFDVVESLAQLQRGVHTRVNNLKELKENLTVQKQSAEQKKKELLSLRATLSDQKKLVEDNTSATNRLLSTTKNKEATYQKTIAEKQKLKEQFLQELFNFESQLKITIDQSALPSYGAGVLKWPLDKVRLTQRFGMTEFAAAGAYNGQGHNGIDFAASIGTPVKAALAGTIVGIGDTDKTCAGASYGKWVLIRHNNGLSTLYAHLSLIKVSTGAEVQTGDIIGYSGVTGYATGPHLHFSVYATQGVQIMQRKSKVCASGVYTMPVADLKAYLNPLLYL